MTTNPNDYDPNELRGTGDETEGVFLGGGSRDGAVNAPGGGAFGADDVIRSNQYRELIVLEQATDRGGLERPYLGALPQSYAAEVVILDWLEFLVDRTGFRRTLDVLRYYRSIEWISTDVETRLREYLSSFDDAEAGGTGDLDRSDHVLSLVYVARLAAMD